LGVSQLKMSTKIDITAFCNNSKPALNDSAADTLTVSVQRAQLP